MLFVGKMTVRPRYKLFKIFNISGIYGLFAGLESLHFLPKYSRHAFDNFFPTLHIMTPSEKMSENVLTGRPLRTSVAIWL